MASASPADVKFEIGHVLFIDIVGYSKLLITEQSELLRRLNDVVRETAQFRSAEAEGKLVRLPTGDGMALVFRGSPEAPVECALELSQRLKAHPELRVRMGIHSGPVKPEPERSRRIGDVQSPLTLPWRDGIANCQGQSIQANSFLTTSALRAQFLKPANVS